MSVFREMDAIVNQFNGTLDGYLRHTIVRDMLNEYKQGGDFADYVDAIKRKSGLSVNEICEKVIVQEYYKCKREGVKT